ncbi:hypothetical protein, partial [Vibrio mediterranei]|uniref:hypothetical protein n=1 Tax=Vibrio mediterranei TaxID=689 RepID=UPI002283C483
HRLAEWLNDRKHEQIKQKREIPDPFANLDTSKPQRSTVGDKPKDVGGLDFSVLGATKQPPVQEPPKPAPIQEQKPSRTITVVDERKMIEEVARLSNIFDVKLDERTKEVLRQAIKHARFTIPMEK